jgi:hypothetical protein
VVQPTRFELIVNLSWLDMPNPNSASSRRSVWIAASPTSKSSPAKSTRGRTTATSTHAKANWQFKTADARDASS